MCGENQEPKFSVKTFNMLKKSPNSCAVGFTLVLSPALGALSSRAATLFCPKFQITRLFSWDGFPQSHLTWYCDKLPQVVGRKDANWSCVSRHGRTTVSSRPVLAFIQCNSFLWRGRKGERHHPIFPPRGQQSAWHSAQETPIPMQGQIRFQIAWIKKKFRDCSDFYCIWPECPGGY